MLPTDPPFRSPVQTLETVRLSIRIDPEEAYVQAFRTAGDEELMAMFGFVSDAELQKQKEKVETGMSTYRTSLVFFHLKDRALGKVVGNCAFHNWFPVHNRSEIGYAMLDESYKGQGYMREAIGPIVAFGFEAMGLNRMEAYISPDNTPSLKLVERAGFRKEGLLREHYCKDGVTGDSVIYGLLRTDYVRF